MGHILQGRHVMTRFIRSADPDPEVVTCRRNLRSQIPMISRQTANGQREERAENRQHHKDYRCGIKLLSIHQRQHYDHIERAYSDIRVKSERILANRRIRAVDSPVGILGRRLGRAEESVWLLEEAVSFVARF